MHYILESPAYFPIHFDRIDWTATYRSDSTIVAPYGKWRHFEEKDIIEDPVMVNVTNKSKKVAWFVSNCNAKNNRLEYAKA